MKIREKRRGHRRDFGGNLKGQTSLVYSHSEPAELTQQRGYECPKADGHEQLLCAGWDW
jgi:hypothetical protein